MVTFFNDYEIDPEGNLKGHSDELPFRPRALQSYVLWLLNHFVTCSR